MSLPRLQTFADNAYQELHCTHVPAQVAGPHLPVNIQATLVRPPPTHLYNFAGRKEPRLPPRNAGKTLPAKPATHPKPNSPNITSSRNSHQPKDSCDINAPTISPLSSNTTSHARNYSTNTSSKPKKYTASHTSSTSTHMTTKYSLSPTSAPNNIKF